MARAPRAGGLIGRQAHRPGRVANGYPWQTETGCRLEPRSTQDLGHQALVLCPSVYAGRSLPLTALLLDPGAVRLGCARTAVRKPTGNSVTCFPGLFASLPLDCRYADL